MTVCNLSLHVGCHKGQVRKTFDIDHVPHPPASSISSFTLRGQLRFLRILSRSSTPSRRPGELVPLRRMFPT